MSPKELFHRSAMVAARAKWVAASLSRPRSLASSPSVYATGRIATVKPEEGGGASRWGNSDAYSSSAPVFSPSVTIAIARKVAKTLKK